MGGGVKEVYYGICASREYKILIFHECALHISCIYMYFVHNILIPPPISVGRSSKVLV